MDERHAERAGRYRPVVLVAPIRASVLERHGRAACMAVIHRRLVMPLMSLFGILTASDVQPVTFEVTEAEGSPWLEVWTSSSAGEHVRTCLAPSRVAGFRFQNLVIGSITSSCLGHWRCACLTQE